MSRFSEWFKGEWERFNRKEDGLIKVLTDLKPGSSVEVVVNGRKIKFHKTRTGKLISYVNEEKETE